MYTSENYRTKTELKNAVKRGDTVTVWQPNDMFGNPKASPNYTGTATVEGPHYPQPHKWYATVYITDGKVTKVS
jgi:hypothetical protein